MGVMLMQPRAMDETSSAPSFVRPTVILTSSHSTGTKRGAKRTLAIGPFPVACRGARQPQVLAQRGANEVITKQPSALQLRNHEGDEILVGTGNVGCRDHEPVAGVLGEP